MIRKNGEISSLISLKLIIVITKKLFFLQNFVFNAPRRLESQNASRLKHQSSMQLVQHQPVLLRVSQESTKVKSKSHSSKVFVNENVLFLAGQVVRGCFNSLDNATASECENETCRACHGLGCNGGIFPPTRLACHICTGNENSTCSGNVNSTHTICPIFRSDDQCYIARPNGNFERGCLSSNPSRCQDGEQCHLCTGNGCNFIDYNSAVNVFSVVKMIPFVLLSIAMAALNK